MREYRLFIGGDFMDAASGDVFETTNPSTGEVVATVAKGVYEAGEYSREWNGRTDAGNEVGTGIYFYRLRVGNESIKLHGAHIN